MEERITLNHRYEIIDKVGGGGMAEVFHGYDTVLHRDVGIKILRDQFIQDKDCLLYTSCRLLAASMSMLPCCRPTAAPHLFIMQS